MTKKMLNLHEFQKKISNKIKMTKTSKFDKIKSSKL